MVEPLLSLVCCATRSIKIYPACWRLSPGWCITSESNYSVFDDRQKERVLFLVHSLRTLSATKLTQKGERHTNTNLDRHDMHLKVKCAILITALFSFFSFLSFFLFIFSFYLFFHFLICYWSEIYWTVEAASHH